MTIPSSKYFPSSLQDRAAWYDNFNTQMQALGLTFGFVAGDLTDLDHDNMDMQFLATSAVTMEAYDDAVRTYRRVITEGNIGDPAPTFPADISLSLPKSIATGMFERLDNMVKRIRVAPNYTPETGALLGIATSGGGGQPIDAFPPKLTAAVDPGNIVEVKFTKGPSDGIYIETNVDNGGWTFTEKAVKSPAVFSVAANTDNTPRGVEIRARFLDGNIAVGDWSDVVTVQTIP